MATNQDYFVKVGSPGTATTMAAPGHTIGGAAITVGSAANWPGIGETVIFAIDTVTIQTINGVATEVRNANSYTEWQGLVTSSTSIGSMTLRTGTDQNYPSGSTTRVYIPVASARENRLVDGISVSLNQDGSLKTTAVQTALGLAASVGAGWTPLAQTFAYGANNGNKEFTITTGSDLTSVLSPGMRFQCTRSTTAPTQSMSFTAASSQYATRATPSGITFTGAFTCEAWVYLNSYGTGTGNQYIVNRENGAGWGFYINSNGQPIVYYGTGGVFTNITSYQSLPLKRWVHVAGVITSPASKTGAIYLNGAAINTVVSGTATSFTQPVADLRVGAISGTADRFFDGYMSELRVWSVAQTQASIQANAAISLTGSETNLITLYQGNGNFNDKTTNANNLTSSGGAIATQVANPYNNVEYAIVTKVAYLAPNTTVTLFTGTDYNIPNMTLSAPQYSAQKTPFGFPSQKGKWKVDTLIGSTETISVGSLNAWWLSANELAVPIGEWDLGYQGSFERDDTANSPQSFRIGLGVSTAASPLPSLTARHSHVYAGLYFGLPISRNDDVSQTAQTRYKFFVDDENNTGAITVAIMGQTSATGFQTRIFAYCAYL